MHLLLQWIRVFLEPHLKRLSGSVATKEEGKHGGMPNCTVTGLIISGSRSDGDMNSNLKYL